MKADDILKSNLCILPWVSVEATPVGSYRPCCLALDEITDELGNVLKVSESTISDAVNSESMNRLRREFAQNNRPETCNRCWAEEDANRTSKRINTLNKFKHEIEMINFEADEIRDIWFLDLKLGNICNLKCRICGSWSSSKWAQEELSTVAYKNKKDNFSYKMLKAGNWPRESQNFWNNVIDVLPDVKYIEFTGGEPFLIEEHFNILRYAAEHGYAKNISVHYNTNATVYPEDILKTIWPEFKEIEIAFSVDNVESRFEYERYGATWAKSCENISKINEAKKYIPILKHNCALR
jgi:Predicted Fe-S oxidoreductases